jgi:hypothetical protein
MIHSLYNKFMVALTDHNHGVDVLPDTGIDLTVQHGERRWAQRSGMTLRVNLYRDGDLVRHTLATNFSLNGLFLRCHQVDMKVGDELSLAIPDYLDGTEKWYPMQVKVARVADNGIGMSFYHHDAHLFSCVSKLMHKHNEQLHAGKSLGDIPHTHEAA